MAVHLTESYQGASWRNTTMVDKNCLKIGVSFRLDDGEVLRFRLDLDSSRHLAETLLYALGDISEPVATRQDPSEP